MNSNGWLVVSLLLIAGIGVTVGLLATPSDERLKRFSTRNRMKTAAIYLRDYKARQGKLPSEATWHTELLAATSSGEDRKLLSDLILDEWDHVISLRQSSKNQTGFELVSKAADLEDAQDDIIVVVE